MHPHSTLHWAACMHVQLMDKHLWWDEPTVEQCAHYTREHKSAEYTRGKWNGVHSNTAWRQELEVGGGSSLLRHTNKGTQEINCCGSDSIHDIYQKFYYCALNLHLIPKPSTTREYQRNCYRPHIFSSLPACPINQGHITSVCSSLQKQNT